MDYNDIIDKGFVGEPYSAFFDVWPWMGLGAAIVLLILLFCTHWLRSDKTKSRFFDPVSLAWMAVVVYLLHNVEEYGCDLYGNKVAFAIFMEQLLGMHASEASCLCTNLCFVWIVGPLTAVFVQRGYYSMAAGMAMFELVNGSMHVGQMINLGCYNPGALNSLVMCLPLGIWMLYALYGKAKWPKIDMLWLLLSVLFYHVVLIGGLLGAIKIGLPDWGQGLVMVLDACCSFYFWWLIGHKRKANE